MENEYLVLLQNLDAGASGLLGEFNSEGYVIADDIKQELLKANKLISDYKPDTITATAQIGDFSFNFVAYIQLGEGNKKRASVFLIEKGKQGFIQKELLTILHSVVVDVNVNNLELVKKEFNMLTADESMGIDMANSNLLAVIDKKKKVASRSKFLSIELTDANRIYVSKMLSLIKASGPYGSQFIMQYQNMIRQSNLDKNSNDYWLSLKNILDKLIIENASLFDGNIKKRMQELQAHYQKMVKEAKEPLPVAPKSKPKNEAKPKAKSKDKDKDKSKDKGKDKGKGSNKTSTSSQKSQEKQTQSRTKSQNPATTVEVPSEAVFSDLMKTMYSHTVERYGNEQTTIKSQDTGRDL